MTQSITAFFDQINSVMLILDLDGNFVSLNPAAEFVFGFPADELIGKPFVTVLDEFSREKAALMIKKTLDEGNVSEWELDHIQPDSVPVLLGYTTTLIHDAAGMPIGLGAIGTNLTSKLDLTEKLAQANQNLEGTLFKLEKALSDLKSAQSQIVHAEKMRTLGQLVAGIAHEINNPTAFIANNLSQLKTILPTLQALFDAYKPLKDLAGPDQLKEVKLAEQAADLDYLWKDLNDITLESLDGIERIRKIVLSLRNFSRLEEAEMKYADINEGLHNTLQLVLPMCKSSIRMVEKYQHLPQLLCRPGELNQVFLNLLINAIQAIQKDGEIEVSTALIENKIIVSIHDTGIGMDEDTISHLGEPFFTTKPIGTGTGLGLSISYGIMINHHGRIWFESQPGSGTTAWVELPIL